MFLYRFLSENLAYISTLLAMRPPPLEAPGGAAVSGSTAAPAPPLGQASPVTSAAATQQAAPAAGAPPTQPFVLLMDVQANAPNIRLPRSSGARPACPAALVLPAQLPPSF